MNLGLALVLLITMAAQGQVALPNAAPQPFTLTPAVPNMSYLTVMNDHGQIILRCEGRPPMPGKLTRCILSPGHTIEEALTLITQQERLESDDWNREREHDEKQYRNLYDLAVREQKELDKCVSRRGKP